VTLPVRERPSRKRELVGVGVVVAILTNEADKQ